MVAACASEVATLWRYTYAFTTTTATATTTTTTTTTTQVHLEVAVNSVCVYVGSLMSWDIIIVVTGWYMLGMK